MLTFERTEDPAIIGEIIRHPKIYDHVSDDSSPERENFTPTIHPLIWYVLVKDGDELLGLFMLVQQNAVCFEAHTCLLPNAWGKRTIQASREVARWIWQNTTCQRIVTNVPQYNRLAAKLAGAAGMTVFGINPKSFQVHGKLFDQVMYGISRQEN